MKPLELGLVIPLLVTALACGSDGGPDIPPVTAPEATSPLDGDAIDMPEAMAEESGVVTVDPPDPDAGTDLLPLTSVGSEPPDPPVDGPAEPNGAGPNEPAESEAPRVAMRIWGGDDRAPVMDTNTWPARAVVHIEAKMPTKGVVGCTGTLIRPNAVVTAAHCLWLGEWAKEITVRPAAERRSITNPEFGLTYGKDWAVFEDYINTWDPNGGPRGAGDPQYDLGMITLHDDIATGPGYLSLCEANDAFWDTYPFTLFGYSTGRMNQVTGHSRSAMAKSIEHYVDMEDGDSGGPYLLWDQYGYCVGAVNSTYRDCSAGCTDRNIGARITASRRATINHWIDTHGGHGAADSWSRGRYAEPGVGAAAWGANELFAFARGSNNQLYIKGWRQDHWEGWFSLGGQIAAAPAATSWGPDRLDVVVKGSDGQMWWRFYDRGWYQWQPVPGLHLASAPAIASWGPGRLDAFACNYTDDSLWHTAYSNGHWSAWDKVGGVCRGSPSAVSWGYQRLDVVVRATNDKIDRVSWSPGGWSWDFTLQQDPHGRVASSPAISSWGWGRLDVFALGEDDELYHQWWDGNWGAWHMVPGDPTYRRGQPGAASWGYNRIDLFGLDRDQGDVDHQWWSGAWGNWHTIQAVPWY